MQISNSTSASHSLRGLAKPVSPEHQHRAAHDKVSIENLEKDQDRPKSTSATRIDADPQAITLFEQQNQTQASASSNTASSSNSAAYDRPTEQNRSALAAYQRVDNQAQRDNVQQLFGVDVFA
jgi:hypothetical protein